MKNIRTILAGLIIVGCSSPVLAIDVKWSADLENRFMYSSQADLAKYGGLSMEGWLFDYLNGNGPAVHAAADTKKNKDDSDFFAEIKYKMNLSATDEEKKVSGVVGFEFGGTKFGQEPNDTYHSGLDIAGDDNNFELRFAWTDIEVPFDPTARLKIGLMPAGYNKFLWNDTGAGIKYVSQRGSLGYSLGWWRDDVNNGGLGGKSKDMNDDIMAADLTYAFPKGPKVNAFILHMVEGNESMAGATDVKDTKNWIGLSADGQAGAVNYSATAIYLTGSVESRNGSRFTTSNNSSLDRKAYLLNGEATYKFAKSRVRGGWLYSTGDSNRTDGSAENFANIDAYMGYFGSAVLFDNYANDNTTICTPFIQDKGLNMPYVTFDYNLNSQTSVGASYLWVNSAEKIDGNDLDSNGSKDIGHEFSARVSYQIRPGVTFGVMAGYLVAGTAWDEFASNHNSSNVFRSDANLRYQF